jgi:hypothetical protein
VALPPVGFGAWAASGASALSMADSAERSAAMAGPLAVTYGISL